MPRKTRANAPRPMRPRRFNEAAARCRGKLVRGVEPGLDAAASMRPRPDAAENGRPHRGRRHRRRLASMRPRPDAAENMLSGDIHEELTATLQ